MILSSVLLACHPSTTTDPTPTTAADPCPRAGVVLPQMRDVERDAEGVSYAVFGPLPDHAADWDRAGGVLSLLESVWSDATTACPGLPSDAVAAVDGAITSLRDEVPLQDQAAAARSANDIHLQMAPLFAYFGPETPVEVVRMDAYFLRIGVDAWFGDWDGYAADLTALQADWATVRPAATAAVPTCHRVAGTATVVDDLDQTLTLLAGAAGTDVDTAQLESDAGLLEVDILELLFDCPPDGDPPATGLGSACASDGDCDGGLVCDTTNAGGRCAPDPADTHVGESCTTTVDCGTYSRDACNNEIGDGYPGGYCTLEPCDDIQVCPGGATCVALPFETPACLKSCSSDADCRASEGYVCQLFPTTPPNGFGPSDHACAFPCTTDDECTSPLTCEVSSGRCVP
ncbi:MAG: hypothetical protein KC621_32630 [Myxococcales bacterium]|nr:hypothetical protein [Myxococcales bacterium]